LEVRKKVITFAAPNGTKRLREDLIADSECSKRMTLD